MKRSLIFAVIGLLALALYGGAVVASPSFHVPEHPLEAPGSLILDRTTHKDSLSADSDTSLSSAAAISLTTVEIRDEVRVPDVKRLGINVGARTWWGAAQFLKNLIDNPGFEAGVYGMVAHAATSSSGQRFEQDFWDTTWNNDTYNIGQPVGFWNGAEYEIVYGPAKGRHGTVISSTHENNHYTYYLDSNGTAPEQWDVMFLRKTWNGTTSANEWSTPVTTTTRPGSPGKQSLHMISPGNGWEASFSAYQDSYWRDGDTTAGKLLLIQGNWHVEFWAKGNRPGAQLQARFFREGEADFINQTISLTTTWQHYTFDAYVPPGTDKLGPYAPGDYHPLVGFLLILPNAGDEAWVDDAALYSTDDTNPTVFTDAFVNRLKELRPGVLRDWGNQLGSTLDVQLAEPWARGTQGYRPHERIPNDYSYSLHEFLQLCKEVGAEPWYVIPVTFSPDDMSNLTEYLAAPADGTHPYADRRAALGQTAPWTEAFATIHLEFGNEAWGAASGGDPFMGESLLGGERLGTIANDRFGILKSNLHFNPNRFDLIIGGQAGWPGQNYYIQSNSSVHNTIALAPYFGVLDTHTNDNEIYYPLFARTLDDVTNGRVQQCYDEIQRGGGQGTGLAIYELSFHTTDSADGASLAVRNDFVTGQGGALALPLHMLLYMRELGVKTQTAFSALQYSFRMDNGEYVRLWGMLRDLYATGRKRPTWLGVELANRAIQGDMLRTTQSGDNPHWIQSPINGVSEPITVTYVQSFAFREGDRYSAILFNLSLDRAQRVRLSLPVTPKRQAALHQIAPASIHANNEDSEQVTIHTLAISDFANSYELDLPPYSVTALTWEAALLDLMGTPGDSKIYLNWSVNSTLLPMTSTWRISYYTQTVASTVVATDSLTHTARAYTLTDLTNYAWYTVTLNAMQGATSFLTDTVRVMPTDRLVYLPLILDQVEVFVLREH